MEELIKKRLRIHGMDKPECVEIIREALNDFPDIVGVEIDERLQNAYVTMRREILDKALVGAIARAGYELLKIVPM